MRKNSRKEIAEKLKRFNLYRKQGATKWATTDDTEPVKPPVGEELDEILEQAIQYLEEPVLSWQKHDCELELDKSAFVVVQHRNKTYDAGTFAAFDWNIKKTGGGKIIKYLIIDN